MKRFILSLSSLLLIASPVFAGLDDRYVQQEYEATLIDETCKGYFERAQFVKLYPNGRVDNYNSDNYWHIKNNGQVVLVERYADPIKTGGYRYECRSWCSIDVEYQIGSHQIAIYKIEGEFLVSYSQYRNENIKRTVQGATRVNDRGYATELTHD